MLKVVKERCTGCGLCTESCPLQAISMSNGYAQIDVSRCRECRLCLEACPQGAITETAPASNRELQATVSSLKQKTADIIKRIDELQHPEHKPDDLATMRSDFEDLS